MAFSSRIFGNNCRPLMAAVKTIPFTYMRELLPPSAGLKLVCPVSPALAEFLGTAEASRAEALEKIWAYIKSNNLQNPNNKREIYCDDKLKTLFGGNDLVNFYGIAKFLPDHFPKVI